MDHAADPKLEIRADEMRALRAPPVRDGGRGLLQGIVLGGYRLAGLLGAGGMAEVYRGEAVDPATTPREVAVKVLRAAACLGREGPRRFLREARVARGIVHRNVLPVLEAGERDGAWFLILPLVEGESLQRWVEANGPLDWRLALRAVLQAAHGLAAVHGACIVHRDVKPANLIIGRLLAEPVRRSPLPVGSGATAPPPLSTVNTQLSTAFLADFGLARVSSGSGALTATGIVVGTPAYMSPEQCEGRVVDARADLYALGATLFFCLTGRPPFVLEAGEGPLGLMERQVRQPAPRADRLNPLVPAAVARVVAKCLEKRPDARYQTAEAIIADGLALLEGRDPVLASGDDSSMYYTRAFAARDIPDAVVDACLHEQAAARARGQASPPLGELLVRRGALRFPPRPGPGPGLALHCLACGPLAATARLEIPVPRCIRCGGTLAASPGIQVEVEDNRLVLVPAATGDDVAAGLQGLLADARVAGLADVVLDCGRLERLADVDAIWITDALEAALGGGGSLALVVPHGRDRAFLASVGVDLYARVVPSRGALREPDPPALPWRAPDVVEEEPTPVG